MVQPKIHCSGSTEVRLLYQNFFECTRIGTCKILFSYQFISSETKRQKKAASQTNQNNVKRQSNPNRKKYQQNQKEMIHTNGMLHNANSLQDWSCLTFFI